MSDVLVLPLSLLIRGILAALRQIFHLSGCPDFASHLSGAGSQQPIELAGLLERVESSQGCHHGLARLAVDPMALHHLEIFEAT